MSEIKFFGFQGSSNSNLLRASNDEVDSFGIRIPAASALTLSQIKQMSSDSFSWPLVVRKNKDFSEPNLVKSESEFLEAIDDVRDLDETILFNLPPIKSNKEHLEHVYAYMGVDFTCVHDYKVDRIIVSSVNNSDFFKISKLDENKVVRFVAGPSRLYFDSIFSRQDPRLAPIFTKTFDDPNQVASFVSGYKGGYLRKDLAGIQIKNRFNSDSFVGDPYSLGYMLGVRMQYRIGSLISNFSLKLKMSEVDMFRIRASLSEKKFENLLSFISIHNKICKGELCQVHLKDLDFIMNKNCAGLIPNTFIMCGEGGNYCSDNCQEYSKVNNARDHVSTMAQVLYESHNNQSEVGDIYFDIPGTIPSLKIETTWNSKLTQFRIVDTYENNVSIRLQASNVEVNSRLIGEIDSYNILAWKEPANLEWDIGLSPEKMGIDIPEFKVWMENVKNLNYCNKSNYSGSSAKYAPLTFKSDVGFLSGDLIVIPVNLFMKVLESKNIKNKMTLED